MYKLKRMPIKFSFYSQSPLEEKVDSTQSLCVPLTEEEAEREESEGLCKASEMANGRKWSLVELLIFPLQSLRVT